MANLIHYNEYLKKITEKSPSKEDIRKKSPGEKTLDEIRKELDEVHKNKNWRELVNIRLF